MFWKYHFCGRLHFTSFIFGLHWKLVKSYRELYIYIGPLVLHFQAIQFKQMSLDEVAAEINTNNNSTDK